MNASSPLTKFIGLIAGIVVSAALLATGVTQEVPRSRITGKVTLKENGRGFRGALVTVSPLFGQEDDNVRTRVAECAEDGSFRVSNVIAGPYRISVSGEAHEYFDQQISVQDGEPLDVPISMKPMEPYLDLYAEQHVFRSGESAELKVKGFIEADRLSLQVYKLDFNKVIKEGSLYSALAPLSGGYGRTAKNPATMGASVVKSEHRLQNRDVEGVFIENLKLDALKPGIYWAQCGAKDLTRGTWINVSDIAVVTKQVDDRLLAFVTDMASGKPVVGAEVGYALAGKYNAAAKSDASGLARLSLPTETKGKGVVVMASSAGSRGFVDFQRPPDEPGRQTSFFTYTDRPIYRPGDTVMFKSLIRILQGSQYVLPPAGTATVVLRDESDEILATSTLPVSPIGNLHGSFDLNPELAPGSYQIEVAYQGAKNTKYVTVAAYRKPQYSIKVTPEQPSYLRGDQVRMKVQVEYYFGGPVVGAKVEAFVNRAPKWVWYDDAAGDEEEYESEYSSGGDFVGDFEATTDSNGTAFVEFSTAGKESQELSENDYIYTLSASVSDDAGQYFDGEGKVTVARGDLAIGVRSSRWIADRDQDVEVEILATRTGSNEPAANQSVDVYTAYEVWGDKVSAELPQNKFTVNTDATGKATLKVRGDKSGSLLVNATATDSRGNRISSRDYIYISGGAASHVPDVNVELKLDKRKYAAGDTAKAMISTNKPGGFVLVTLEGENLYETKCLPLEASTVVEFEVKDEYAPNAFVSVAFVHEKKFYEATRRLNINLGKRTLDVKVTSDKETYQPGETATYTVQTRAETGEPVSADVSLGLVDESIYALAQDNTDIAEAFYPRRYNRVATNYSFPEMYLDGGDKASSEVQIRRKFKDTAFWNPSVTTDASGQATVQVVLPDNLTQWRATAVACSADTFVGQATQQIRVKKPLMIRLQGPAFVTSKDSQQVTALVTNESGEACSIAVKVAAQGATLAGGIETLDVAEGETKSVDFTISAATGQEVILVATAVVSDLTDGVELKIPVEASGARVVSTHSGVAKETLSQIITVPSDADEGFGSLKIRVRPTIVSNIAQSLDGLIDFPFGCVEQTMSRFMPSVIASKLMKDLGLPPSARAADLPAIINQSLTRLGKMQLGNGGFGWFEYDSGNPFMTAYVLEGLHLVRAAGVKTPDRIHRRALEWADEYLKSDAAKLASTSEWSRVDLVYLAYAVTLYSKSEPAKAVLKAVEPISKDSQIAAFRALAWRNLGNAELSAKAVAELKAMAQKNGDYVHWGGTYGVENTARALYALTKLGDNSLTAAAARHLGQDRWYSTRDTAFAIIGLSEYLKSSAEMNPNATVQVTLNGKTLANLTLTKASIVDPALVLTVPMSELTKGENRLEVRKQGTGVAYIDSELVAYVNSPPAIPGATITREYRKLEPQALEDGTMRLLPGKSALTAFSAGDLVAVTLTVRTDADLEYFLIEDPVPAGFRVTEREDLADTESWNWWYSKLNVFDDRVASFARSVPKGSSVITYVMRAESPGTSVARPLSAYNMYAPNRPTYAPAVEVTIR